MKMRIAIAMLAALVCAGAAHAACQCPKCRQEGDLGQKTASTVTDTARTAVNGTASVAETSVRDTAAAPTTAIQAVKDTANTALIKADAAIKSLTGEKD